MITFWSGPGGALLCDQPIADVTQDLSETPDHAYGGAADSMKYYGGRYFIGETITRPTARKIAEALGGKYLETGHGEIPE